MITDLPSRIQRLLVAQPLLNASREYLEPYRLGKLEGCLLWYGYVLDEGNCIVTTCVRPPQTNRPRSYSISAEGMRTVRHAVRPFGLLLLVQIHTHPVEAFFSEWDEQNALNKAPGALNMILPDYGSAPWIDTNRFCVVENDGAENWRPWEADDWKRLEILPAGVG